MSKYTYKDAQGTEHCTTTDTSGPTIKYESMENLMYTIHEGGDHTKSHKTVYDPTSKNRGALGNARI